MIRENMKIAVVALALSMACAVPQAAEATSGTKAASSDFGIGVVTVLANIAYMPVKVCYGVLGGITGSFAYVLSGGNRAVADGVWIPSLGGDYVLTTDMMKGRESVHFNGVRPSGAHTATRDEPPADDEAQGSSF